MAVPAPLKTFIIYARADEEFKKQLLRHLRPLHSVSVWHDGNILPGEEWDATIKRELKRSELVLFLVSADSLYSDYIQSEELKTALELLQKGQARLVPIVVAPCAWKFVPIISGLQALPLYKSEGVKPVRSWTDPDEAWASVVEHLGELAEEIHLQRSAAERSSKEEAERRHAATEKQQREAQERARREKATAERETARRLEREQASANKSNFSGKSIATGIGLLLLSIAGINYCNKDDTPIQPAELSSTAAKKLVPDMVLVKGTSFQMGSSDGQDDEKPVHKVTVSDFYLGKYEVTLAEFKAFVDDSGYQTDAEKEGWSYAWTGTSWDKKNGVTWRDDVEGNRRPVSEHNHPVIHVSWNDAKAYCAWLTEKTGRQYRLPTEAEWEYAAGNGAKHHKYSWGDGNPTGKKGGNVADETGANKFNWKKNASNIFVGYNDGYAATAPVGSFDENDFGLHDMSGNVWEWCEDWYHSDYKGAPADGSAWLSPAGSYRVVRGGSWNSNPQNVRAADRSNDAPGNRVLNIGFRLARTK